MSVTLQSFETGFVLKPMRRRSSNTKTSTSTPVFLPRSAYPVVTGLDYFQSSNSASLSTTSFIDEQNTLRRASAPVVSKVYPSVTPAPLVSVRRVAEEIKQHEFPDLDVVKQRRASYPPTLKSCFRSRQTKSARRGSVQFFGFVQVQYTHAPADYDRTAISCIANNSENRAEQLEEFRQWQNEMTEKMTEMPIENAVSTVTTVDDPEFPPLPTIKKATSGVKASINSLEQSCPEHVNLVEAKHITIEVSNVKTPQRKSRRNRNKARAN